MSLVFTFLCATNQGNDLTLKGTWDFQTKLVEGKGTRPKWLDKTKKKNFIVNKLEEDKDQAIVLGTDRDKCKWARENISLSKSSISKLERLQLKLKFQGKR